MTLLLRTLSLKSVLGFGRFDTKDLTVQQMIDSGQRKQLVKMYFGLSMISFTDEVLNMLHIKHEDRIPKPGKLFQGVELNNHVETFMQRHRETVGIKAVSHEMKIAKQNKMAKEIFRERARAMIYSKSSLKGINQKS
jgi:hypothetical protein